MRPTIIAAALALSLSPVNARAFAPDVIGRVVRSHLRDVRRCYETELAAHPQAQGRVTVRFTVAVDGQVSSAQAIETPPALRSVGACIATAVRQWRFPQPPDGREVTVSYPFVLAPPSP